MERIITIDLADYEPDMPRFRRPSVRGIISRDGKLAMVHSLKYDYYKFPGGGIGAGESNFDALAREVLEETGLTVIPESVAEFGSVLRVQRSLYKPDTVFEQENFYYTCEAGDTLVSQKLDDYEDEEGFTLEFVLPEAVVEVNRTHGHGDYDEALIEREALVAELIMKRRDL